MIVKIDETLKFETENENPDTSAELNSTSNSMGMGIKAKLPKIVLKKFQGDPIQYNPFWDAFSSAVDENQQLSDVDKFNYLKNLLEGPAAAAIKGLPLTADNYGAAKEILEKRFGQKQIVINAHMEGLVKLSPVSCNHNLKRLGQLYHQVESHVGALQALGIDKDAYGTLLVPLLLEKIPMDLCLIISTKIDTLLQLFDNEIEARERCEVMTRKIPKKPNYTQQPKGRKINPSTAAALLNQGTKSVSCTYCRGEHPSAHCTTITDINARKTLETTRKVLYLLSSDSFGKKLLLQY